MENKLKIADTAIHDAEVFLRDTFSEEGWEFEIKIIAIAIKDEEVVASDSFEELFNRVSEVSDNDQQ